MTYYIVKLAVTSVLIVSISEFAKRSTFAGALLASLPVTSCLAMIWIYAETKDTARIAKFSSEIFWLVLPSLAFFLLLPVLLKKWGFVWSFLASGLVTAAIYQGAILLGKKAGWLA